MLTNATVKAARPGARPVKLWDAAGLHLLVTPAGHRAWRLRSRAGGRERVLTLGSWPELSIDAARERAARIRAGATVAQLAPAELTFEDAARRWHAHMVDQWTAVHAADVLASLERDVFDAIGAIALAELGRPRLLELLRQVERRGCRQTALRLRQRLSKIFRYAMSEGWCEADPAAEIGGALRAPAPPRKQPALIDQEQCRQLLADVDALVGAPVAKLASRFLALTAVRGAAVRGARWDEIEDLDGLTPLWRVPAARVKLRADKKDLAEHDHLVPLAPAAIAVLREAHRFSRRMQDCQIASDGLIFPGRGPQALGEGAIGALYDRAGYAGRHVPHGWRASFSTILNEARPADRALIDQALGHALKRDDGTTAKVEGAYNRALHLAPRRVLLEAWAEILMR